MSISSEQLSQDQIVNHRLSRRQFLALSGATAVALFSRSCVESEVSTVDKPPTRLPRPTSSPTVAFDESQQVESSVLVYSWKELWDKSGGTQECWENPENKLNIETWKEDVAKASGFAMWSIKCQMLVGIRLKKVRPVSCDHPNY